MGLLEGLTISALGMGVVFAGLLLTSLFIVAFPRVAARRRRRKPAPAPPAPPPPEIVGVIAAVLEAERRLTSAGYASRLTIVRERVAAPRSRE